MDTRTNLRDNPSQKQKKANHNYGNLKFGKTESERKKIILKTFFGNPEIEIFCIRFDPEDQMIAAGCSDGGIKVFSLLQGKLVQNLQGSSGVATPTTTLRWRPYEGNTKTKGVILSGNADGSLIFWHSETGKQLHRIVEHNNQILAMDFKSDGSLFVTGGKDFSVKNLRVYDDEKKEVIRTMGPAEYSQPGHANRVFSIKFLKDQPEIFMSGGWDGNVLLWDLRASKSIGTIHGPNLSGDSLDYRNGQMLSGSYRSTEQIQIWDFKQRTLIRQIDWDITGKNENYYIYSCQFSLFSKNDDETIIAGTCGLQEFKVFDGKSDYKATGYIEDLSDGVYAVDYAQKGTKFAFGGGEGVVYICSLVNVKP